MDLKTVGKRFKDIRIYLGFTQGDVAEATKTTQTNVSRLEKGGDLGSHKLLIFLNFYSKYIYVDFLFDDRFDILFEDKRVLEKKIGLNSIMKEKTIILKEDVLASIDNFRNIVARDLDKIINLHDYGK